MPAPGRSIWRTRSIHGPARVDHHPRADLERRAVQAVDRGGADDASAERLEADDLDVVQHQRAGLGGTVQRRQRQPRVVREVVVVQHRAAARDRCEAGNEARAASVDSRRGRAVAEPDRAP